MNLRIKIIFSVLTILFTTQAYSQANETGSESKHFIGLNASSISGIGLSYGYFFIPGYMFKINGFYYESQDKHENFSGDEYYTREIDWCAGAEIAKDFFKADIEDLRFMGYALIGGGYWYEKSDDPEYPSETYKSSSWTAGAAFGIRAIFFEHLSFNLECGFQYGRDFDDRERYAGIAGGIGAHFAF